MENLNVANAIFTALLAIPAGLAIHLIWHFVKPLLPTSESKNSAPWTASRSRTHVGNTKSERERSPEDATLLKTISDIDALVPKSVHIPPRAPGHTILAIIGTLIFVCSMGWAALADFQWDRLGISALVAVVGVTLVGMVCRLERDTNISANEMADALADVTELARKHLPRKVPPDADDTT